MHLVFTVGYVFGKQKNIPFCLPFRYSEALTLFLIPPGTTSFTLLRVSFN